MNLQAVAEGACRDQSRDILELLSITDSSLLSDSVEFWRRVALRLHMTPRDNHVDNAQACIEQAGGFWEEDYVVDGELSNVEVTAEFLALLISLEGDELEAFLEGDRQIELPMEDEGETPTGTIGHDTTQRNLGDLVNEVIDNQINLSPEFQREYVWPRVRALRYIESLLMDIPTPSILLYEVGGGPLGVDHYDVVDGRQRLETLLRFIATREQLEDLGYTRTKQFKTPKDNHKDFKSFQVNGILHDYSDKFFSGLEPGMQLKFKHRKIPVTVIRANDRKMLYHVFERYNLGSQKLNAAEVRNAVYQDFPIHKTLWELAREASQVSAVDPEESSAIEQLREIMGKKKRYGTYDFIGRVMAFTYLKVMEEDAKPSANVGTNRFFDNFEDTLGDHLKLRQDFVKTFYKVGDWYDDDFAFVRPPGTDSRSSKVQFHAWAATLQMATTHYLRLDVEKGLLDEDKIINYIQSNWCAFAGIDPNERLAYKADEVGNEGQPFPGIFQTPQNASNFWRTQKEWHQQIENASISEN